MHHRFAPLLAFLLMALASSSPVQHDYVLLEILMIR